ncbi:MAG TPA: hypothetical protein VMB34_11165 [Acetobacteraceae bacterium]|nr:hypothetical protein [Acetobacteraceae bacterium]
MATTPESQPAAKGLDLGTSRIVLSKSNGQKVSYSPQLNAFVDLPHSKMTEQMLTRENILHRVEGDHIYAYGNRVDEFAKFLSGDARRPMQNGMLNPNEPKNLEMVGLLLQHLCGAATPGDKLCFSVPSPPPDHASDLVFHERSMQGLLEQLGYQTQPVNEGLAVIYAELKDANFTGIGMSFGGGMCNICLAYLGLPVLTVATTRAGDYIDCSAASVTGETPTTVRLRKENGAGNGFSLDRNGGDPIERALSVYYADVIEAAVASLQAAVSESKKLPRITDPMPIVCAGGTTMAPGFLGKIRSTLGGIELPLPLGEVHIAKDPINTTAKGALVGAMLNM